MADDRLNEALDIMARNVVHNLLCHEDALADLREEYPGIGHHDWEQVMRRVGDIGKFNYQYSEETYAAAYGYLEARADAE